MQYDQARIPFYEHLPSHKGIIHPEAYLEAVKAVESSTQPVDCWGSQGDVVLWHHRLGHMAGHHRGTEASIRQALLFDYNHVDLDKQRLDPPQQNMWRDWSDAVNAADANLSPEFLANQGIH